MTDGVLMSLDVFVDRLQPHDASLGVALLELVRHADETGSVERGEWLMAVRGSYPRAVAPWETASLGGSAAAHTGEDEVTRYVEEHALARLSAAGLVAVHPPGEAWERVRLVPGVWAAVEPRRDEVAHHLEHAVRNLLQTGDRRATAAAGIAEDEGGTGVPLAEDRRAAGSTLSARGLVKVFRSRKVVNEVDVEVSQGEIVGLLGPNGAGKTTTFYMMVGLISPDSGSVHLDEEELTRVPMYRRARRGIGYLAQEPSVFRRLTVEENIMAILETLPISRAERKERLERLLDELTIRHLRKAKAYSLSGGERRRLEITRALVSQPKFMLLDEPFAGVDPIAVHDIQQIVAGLRHRGIGVIITDHNVEQTLDIVDRAYIMYDGRVRVSGTVAELVWNDEVAEIYFGPTLTARMRNRYPGPRVA
jgi:lipopolysaccharide export system ATP-binding protein